MDDMTLEQANAAVAAALAKAREIGAKMNIAVVDAGANLKAFARMDGAWIGSIDIALRKARTARFFDMNTGELGKLSQPGESLFGIEHSNGGLITFPGGVPIRNQGGAVLAPSAFPAARLRTTTPWPWPVRRQPNSRRRAPRIRAEGPRRAGRPSLLSLMARRRRVRHNYSRP